MPIGIAPVQATGVIVYWTTSAGTALKGFAIGDESVETVLVPGQVTETTTTCIGCHTSTPDGNYAEFTTQGPWGNAIGSVQAGMMGTPPSFLSAAGSAALEQAPLERGAYLELALGGIAAAAGALLALLLVLLLSAQSRQLTLARAATMGMSTVQARLLVLIEALPQILAVIVGGLICALALAPLVGPALGLSVFTGSATPVPVRIEPALLTGAALALLILAIATLSGQAVLAGRGTARSLRIGG